MQNFEVAWIFHELADLLEFKGEDFFKIRAYRNAARVLACLEEPLEEIWKRGELAKIPGIGKNIAAKINEVLATGHLKKHEELLQEIPPGLLEIMSLPGIGPKRAGLIYRKLGVASLEELARAAREGRVRSLPGMGSKTESDIIRNIEMREDRAGRVLLATARELAGELAGFLKILPGVSRVEAGGSLRRWQETVGDIDLVVAASEPEPVIQAAVAHPRVREITERSGNRFRFQTQWGISVDLEIVPEELFVQALFRSTGSKAHYRKIQGMLAGRGKHVESDFAGRAGKTFEEADIYASLDLPFIPPELREDRGEVEAALQGRLPRLVELKDIKGDLHIHTTWSDGLGTVEQMAARAREKGYQYIAVTDHSQSLKIARGLSLNMLREQHRAIRSLNEQNGDFRILTGIEVDILPKGGLDCPDELLKEADLVVASVHSAFKQDRETMTARIISAVENRNVDIIGHLTGRLIGQREEYALDLERVLEAAASCGTILEINSSPDRLDLNDINARKAREKGIKMAISTDAHDLKRMDEMLYGVSVARRAWLEPGDILNTMDIDELLQFLRKR
ncbi:MAG: DNA polymerase/3'-5' exonuclease PolX [Pelotomaculum sp.]|uniref:DNA polymerase beta n=1 Tax=Pelotomaculum thermopropionicum (strain DSM 13744 / JCM 10971 / SI) TaxID=370438 RepID=A5D0X4_PELTS|nr:DNA polymerase/3'-5' exonuclease PolX [Pelotomaculum sp.]BAF60128.1 DNA polymerase IV, histidinol phosphatase and related hydrolases [Pelotomaculum thermopropionicum SI]